MTNIVAGASKSSTLQALNVPEVNFFAVFDLGDGEILTQRTVVHAVQEEIILKMSTLEDQSRAGGAGLVGELLRLSRFGKSRAPFAKQQCEFHFTIHKESALSRARVGTIHTPHGVMETPGFVPVGTQAALKNIDVRTADDIGVQLMFVNTFHMMVHPGGDVVERMGGLHKYMNRNGPIITDSGGFQVFSMMAGSLDMDQNVGLKGAGGKKRDNLVVKIDKDGVVFRSYRDGALIRLTPETSVATQKQLGADIIIPLDHLLPYSASSSELSESVSLSHEWEKRSLEYHMSDTRRQAMYSVVHGGMDFSLRRYSVDYLSGLPFDGHAIGGSLGKTRDDLQRLLEFTLPLLPKEKPNHILGIGDFQSIINSVKLGADTFDSSYPTRAARHGNALSAPHEKMLSMRKTKYLLDERPLMKDCNCFTCQNYSRSYLHHLVKTSEPTGDTLLAIHNVWRMLEEMKKIRKQIIEGDL